MSLLNRTKEVNYWPSISDMFLVFFVIALVVYAQNRSEGDTMESELLVQESNFFFQHYAPDRKYEGETGEDVDLTTRPQLAQTLYEAYLEYRQQHYQKPTLQDAPGYGTNYRTTIDMIATQENAECKPNDLPYQKLRAINQHRKSQNSQGPDSHELDELKKQIATLQIEAKKLKDTNNCLIAKLEEERKTLNEKIGDLQKQLDKNSREQIVTISEDMVQFEPGKNTIKNNNQINDIKRVYEKIRSVINDDKETQPRAIVVEIIGHTDDNFGGHNGLEEEKKMDEREVVAMDSVNPGLGLQRALTVRNVIVNTWHNNPEDKGELKNYSYYALTYKEIPIYFKCYSAAWLTPISFSKEIEQPSAKGHTFTREKTGDGKKDRRIEVFIRPVWDKKK